MNRLNQYISSQCSNPQGIVGKIITAMQNLVNDSLYRNATALVNIKADDKVLDIGYGNGHLLKMIYRKTGADLYGIDISNDAKAMAVKRNKEAGRSGKLHLSVGDCCDLPYKNDIFSAVTSINTVYFWSDTLKGLSEICRTLKSGGHFYNVLYTKDFLDKVSYTRTGFKKFEPKELALLSKKAGFKSVRVKTIAHGNGFIMICKK